MNLLSKKVPQDLKAELSIIGSLLIDTSAIETASSIVNREDFYNDYHGMIFEKICNMKHKEQEVDLTLLRYELDKILLTENVEWIKFLTSAIQSVTTSLNIKDYCKIVFEKSQARKIATISESIKNMSFDNKSIEEIQSEVGKFNDMFETLIDELQNVSSEDVFKEILDDLSSGVTQDFIKTGYHQIDRMIGGLEKGKYSCVAARTSVGKTAFATALAFKSIQTNPNLKVIFFSLEMTKKQLLKRLMSNYFDIDGKSFINGLSEEEKTRIKNNYQSFMNIISKMEIYDEKAYSVNEIKNILKSYKKKHGSIDLIVIDYISLIKTDRKFQSRNYEVESVSQELKQLTKLYNCHILALQQLNRAGDVGADHKPKLSHLKDSGSVEQDLDLCLLLHRKDYGDIESKYDDTLEVIIAKNRDGATGSLNFKFIKDKQQILEVF